MADTKKKEKALQLSFQVPSVVFDGHGIGGKGKDYKEVVFFQIRKETDTEITGQVVASLRMNIEQVKGLRDALENVLKLEGAEKPSKKAK